MMAEQNTNIWLAKGKHLRIGLLGASKIAPNSIIRPARKIPLVTVQAVAARDLKKAQRYAKKYAIPHAVDSYHALLQRQDIDLVYIALPPVAHAKWSIAALNAGKHVLCEKPFAMNMHEATEMVNAAKVCNRVLIEGYHYRFHPVFHDLQALLPLIGPIQHVDSSFCFPFPKIFDDFRFRSNMGGGALMDLGCYCVHLVSTVLSGQLEVEEAVARDKINDVDNSMKIAIYSSEGATADLDCSMRFPTRPRCNARIIGSNGSIQLGNFVNSGLFHNLMIETPYGMHKYAIKSESTYYYQLRHIKNVLSGGTEPLTGGSDAIETMRLIDDSYRLAGFDRMGTDQTHD